MNTIHATYTPADARCALAPFPDPEMAEDAGLNVDTLLEIACGRVQYIADLPLIEHEAPPPAALPPQPNAPAYHTHSAAPKSARPTPRETAEVEKAIFWLYALAIVSAQDQNPAMDQVRQKKVEICEKYFQDHPGAKKWRFYAPDAKEKEKRPRNNFLAFGKSVIDTYHRSAGEMIVDAPRDCDIHATRHYDFARERAIQAYQEARRCQSHCQRV